MAKEYFLMLLFFGVLCTCEDINKEEDATVEVITEEENQKSKDTKSNDITAEKLGLSKKDLCIFS